MKKKLMLGLFAWLIGFSAFAMMNAAQMSVWVNEAIISTYTYTAEDVTPRQKSFAHYFTAEGWIAYNKALSASGLIAAVKKNSYQVSAVATMPPMINQKGKNAWVATMPVLVLYKNPQQQQKQTLEVVIHFMEVPEGQGVRGLAISSFQTIKSDPPCICQQ